MERSLVVSGLLLCPILKISRVQRMTYGTLYDQIRQRLVKNGQNLTRIGKKIDKICQESEIDQIVTKLTKFNKCQKLTKFDKDWSKMYKIDKNGQNINKFCQDL